MAEIKIFLACYQLLGACVCVCVCVPAHYCVCVRE